MHADKEKFRRQRMDMVDQQLRARDIHEPRVLAAMAEVPREKFIPPQYRHEAYADRPVAIGAGQTISQPYIVALMTQELDVQPHHRVLDVGAGSGYQTAILARLAKEVFAIERLRELAQRAEGVLRELGYRNVSLTVGDGTLGWPEHAPYDRIICGAAGPEVPASWTDQLAEGGRIVMPIGGPYTQVLVVVHKEAGRLRRRESCGVRFVRLIGKDGWPEEG